MLARNVRMFPPSNDRPRSRCSEGKDPRESADLASLVSSLLPGWVTHRPRGTLETERRKRRGLGALMSGSRSGRRGAYQGTQVGYTNMYLLGTLAT